MPNLSVRASRLIFALFLAPLVMVIAGRAAAQESCVAPVQAGLERRVRELEETVRLLKANGQNMQPTAPSRAAASAFDEQPAVRIVNQGTAASPPAGLVESGPAIFLTAPTEEATYDAAVGSGGDPKDADGRPLLAGWNNGFFIQSANKDFVLRITGQIQADYRAFLNENDVTDIDTFLVRRARLGIEATVFKYYEFRLLPDFGQGQSRIQDAYINVHYWDAFQVEAGKFKQPFSYEQLIQDRFVPTLERSMIDQLVPARDVGLMFHGQNLFGDQFDWAFSFSNGEINGDTDTNDLKDLAGRVVWRPFNDPELWPVLQRLQIGIAGTIGVEEEPVNPNTLRTPATVPWFQYNPTVRADGRRDRWSPEVAYFYRSFGLAAQYIRQEQFLRPAFFGAGSQFRLEVPAEGFYVLATYLLTGEERTTYSQPVVPLRPFDPLNPFMAPGVWEFVARVSRLELGDDVFQKLPTGKTTFVRLADPTRFSSGATELTVGFNWYLNAWVRTQFNYEHAWFDDPVRLGPGPNGLVHHSDALLTRVQVIF